MIGGGFPVGALAGRADVLDVMNPLNGPAPFPHYGTFSANPITLTAGSIAMADFDEAAVLKLNALADKTRAGIAEAIRVADVPACVTGSRFHVPYSLEGTAPTTYRNAFVGPDEQKCVSALLDHFFNNGLIMIETCSGLLSTPMTQSEIDQLCQVTWMACARSSRCCDTTSRNGTPQMDKTTSKPQTALCRYPDDAVLMIGGFGGSGAPIELIHALIDRYKATGSPADITVINNNAGNGKIGIAAMIDAGMVAKMICSFRARPIHARSPTNTWPERSRWSWCRKARWRNAFARLARVFLRSLPQRAMARNWRQASRFRNLTGKSYVLERWLRADFAIVKGAHWRHTWQPDLSVWPGAISIR